MSFMRTIGVRLRMETGDYVRDADKATAANQRIKGSLHDTGVKGKADLDKLAAGAGILGAALVGVAAAAVYAATGFDKQMSEVQAVSGATAEELDRLRQAAIQAGAATVFSAKDAAEAESELAKAGISTADILGGALKGSLDLAAAGNLGLADSAEIAAAAMNTFGLKGSDVGHVADVLSAAANKSAAGVDDLGQGLQQVGLVAAQAGLSFEETVGLLAALADRGLKGSDGATSLKTALQRLVAPTDKSATLMKSLGISMYDAAGNMVSASNIAGQLQGALGKLSPAQRNAALQTMFGSDAIRAANVLYEEGATGIDDYVKAVNDQGAASRVAATKLDNLAGDVEQLKGSLETLFISSGEGSSGGLRFLVERATDLTNLFGSMPGPVQSTVVVIAGLTGVALLAASAGLKLRGRLKDIVEELQNTGPAGARAAAGISAVTKWGGRAAIALGALATAGLALDALRGATVDVEALDESLSRLGRTGEATGEIVKQFGNDLSGLSDAVLSLSNPFGEALKGAEALIPGLRDLDEQLSASPTKYAEQLEAVDNALADMQRNGHADEAAAAFKRFWQIAQDNGITLEQLQAAFPRYVAAYGEAQKATTEAGTAASDTAERNRSLTSSLKDVIDAAGGVRDAFDQLNGVTLDWRETERNAEAAVDALQAALKASGGSMDIHNEKGRAAAEAVDKLAQAAADAASAEYNRSKSVDDAAAVYDRYIGILRGILKQAGYSKKAIDELVESIAAMPSTKEITVKANVQLTVNSAQLRKIQDQLSGRAERWGGVTLRHAATGSLRDAGIYSAAAPARYAFAEPGTGGEAFVPKQGNYGRSMSILSEAAGWYGADVVPRGGGWYGSAAPAAGASGGMGGPMIVENHIEIGGEVVRVVRTEISERDRTVRRRVAGRRGR